MSSPPPSQSVEAKHLRDLTPTQWRSGAAAWLGWLFDGLDMHIYTLVATSYVAVLLATDTHDPEVKEKSSWIQAAFLVGWALGGGFFGWVGDRLGRARTLALTILTYALFTGLSFFAQSWWHLLAFRFLAALGIGGEWSVGSSLLSETWPRGWRPWIAAVLQSGVNLGILLACFFGFLFRSEPPKWIFLVGVLPAFIVFWIRRSVPEPEIWQAEKTRAGASAPGIRDLFRGEIRGTTVRSILVCSFGLTAWWAFQFWNPQYIRNLPELKDASDAVRNDHVTWAVLLVNGVNILGNFAAGGLARWLGYRKAITIFMLALFATICAMSTRTMPLSLYYVGISCAGFFGGVWGLFTMYLPPLFPTLLRTTGAGFCYNIGRIAAAAGTILFGMVAPVGDLRVAIFWSSFLFLPAALVGVFLREPEGS